MDDKGNDAPERGTFHTEVMISFAALLSAIPAVLVKLGLDRMIDGLTGNGALPSAKGGATLFSLGVFLLMFPILLALFGLRDEIVTRLRARSEGSPHS